MHHITHTPPPTWTAHLARATAILAATLTGLGVIFWLAANWDTLGRMGQFGLLQASLLTCGLAAWWRAGLRVPAGLLMFLLTGGLLALVGQTYQTGADPWQLFALWAALGLPMAWGTKHDALWTAWVVVLMTALSLWVSASTYYRWRADSQSVSIHLLAWGMSVLTVAGLSGAARPWTGSGPWSQRLAMTLTVVSITFTAVSNLGSHTEMPLYWLGLLTLCLGAALMNLPSVHDLYGLSILALALNVFVVFGLGRWLLDGSSRDVFGTWLLLGLLAAGLLTGTVKLVMQVARRQGGEA